MNGLAVAFHSWKDSEDMVTNGYSIHRDANSYIEPLRNLLFEFYIELKAYDSEDDEDYLVERAELKGKCWSLAYAIGSFYRPDAPEAGLAEARQAVHGQWAEEYGD